MPIGYTPKRKIYALTGNIGSGKSEAAKILEDLGADIIDADILARKALEVNSPAYNEVVELFGPDSLLESGELDRKWIARKVFDDADLRCKLENIVHPIVRSGFLEALKELDKRINDNPIIYVIPLLFESKRSRPSLNGIIVVSATPELSIERIIERDKCSSELANKKYNAQLPIEHKEERADFIIFNNGSLDELKKSVKELYFKKLCH